MRRLFLFCVTISLAFVGSERARSQATIVTDGDLDVGGSVLQIGTPILVSSTTGINLALGPEALANVNPGTPQPEDGKWNTAIGPQALYSNEAGMHNTAVGYRSLRSFTDGCCNTAIGSNALYSNDDSEGNTAVGAGALFSNLNGFGNTAIGDNALRFNTAGSWNVALGHFAGLNATGSGNVLVGAAWLNAIGSDNILINNPGVASENAVIRIGTQGTQTKTFISGIDDQSLAVSANVVCVETTGQLGRCSLTSSRRNKSAIRDIGTATHRLMDLRPVTFRFAEEIAGEETGPQYGLIAEEVAEAMPQLVNYDDQGRPESVKYRFLAPMLLNELQRQQRQIRSLQILLGSSLIFALGLGLARWRSG